MNIIVFLPCHASQLHSHLTHSFLTWGCLSLSKFRAFCLSASVPKSSNLSILARKFVSPKELSRLPLAVGASLTGLLVLCCWWLLLSKSSLQWRAMWKNLYSEEPALTIMVGKTNLWQDVPHKSLSHQCQTVVMSPMMSPDTDCDASRSWLAIDMPPSVAGAMLMSLSSMGQWAVMTLFQVWCHAPYTPAECS